MTKSEREQLKKERALARMIFGHKNVGKRQTESINARCEAPRDIEVLRTVVDMNGGNAFLAAAFGQINGEEYLLITSAADTEE
jgi:hypothetical protein